MFLRLSTVLKKKKTRITLVLSFLTREYILSRFILSLNEDEIRTTVGFEEKKYGKNCIATGELNIHPHKF